tara:strand:- start:1147 stop:1425 length:279 start_codon:yes stop_codon:yes gene_type:complete
MTILSNTDMKYINMAANEARKSKVLMRHGSVAVSGGKVLGRGYNNYRTTSKDNFIQNTCTCHAEIACLRNMYQNCTTNAYGKYGNNIKGSNE